MYVKPKDHIECRSVHIPTGQACTCKVKKKSMSTSKSQASRQTLNGLRIEAGKRLENVRIRLLDLLVEVFTVFCFY